MLPGPLSSAGSTGDVSGMPALSLSELRNALSSRALSGGEVLEAALDRIREWEPALNAFTEICELPVSVRPGPLSGIPVAVKDMFVDRDRVPTVGSKVGGHWLRGTATVIERLRAAGAVVAGYTNLHEWGLDCTSVVTATGPVRNPWDPGRIAGGSSGGSAAALASGAVPAAIGSDTGGSIRIPAACCGVVGLKPTWGRVPLDGFVDSGSPIDHAGPMARTVGDVRTLFEVLAGTQTKDVEVGSLRVGVPGGYFFDDLDPRVASAMSGALHRLSKLVHWLGDVELAGSERSMRGVEWIFVPLTYALLERDLKERPEDFQPETRKLLMAGADITPDERTDGESIRRRTVEAWDATFEEVDVIVTPTLSKLPPRISECKRTLPSGTSAPTLSYLALNAPMDLAGVPALSLPCGFAERGWTVSMTLSAARGRDDVVLALGEAWEEAEDRCYSNRTAAIPNGPM